MGLSALEVAAVVGAANTITKLSEGSETMINWSVGDNLEKMTSAVEGWKATKGGRPRPLDHGIRQNF